MKQKIGLSIALALVALMSMTLGAFAQGPQSGAGFGLDAAPVVGATLDAPAQQALTAALNDEYHARAFYQAVIDQFGQVAPFANIVRAEVGHIAAVQNLMTRYGMAIPADPYLGKIAAPATLTDALKIGVDAEKANVAMYDRFTFITQTDIKAVFAQLRNVSQTRHLPAFENALTGNTASAGFGYGWNQSPTTPTLPQNSGYGRRWTR